MPGRGFGTPGHFRIAYCVEDRTIERAMDGFRCCGQSIWHGVEGSALLDRRELAMKIVILGAGALGSLFGAHLARAGEDVTLIAREARAQAIQEQGVSITGLADFTVPVPVTARPQELRQADGAAGDGEDL